MCRSPSNAARSGREREEWSGAGRGGSGGTLLRAARLIRPSEADRQNKTAVPQIVAETNAHTKKAIDFARVVLVSCRRAPAATNDH